MSLEVLVGSTASFVTVASFIPQVFKVWRSKSARDLSYGMVGLLLLSGGLWATYGFLISDTPVILTNVAVAVLNLAILVAKIRYRNG